MDCTYERWHWMELIGFDNEADDCGVADYLRKVGYIPDAVSLLLYSPDFVHMHDGMEHEITLAPQFCAYLARPQSRERTRQAWTNYQLRALVAEMRRHGTKVYFSFFNLYQYYNKDGQLEGGHWSADRPELHETGADGRSFGFLNPLRRMADGVLYEDFFVERLERVALDYGFDGYHGADGYTSPRLCLAVADYSEDMISQFIAAGHPLPADCPQEARADWIWERRRYEWITFYAGRWETFWRKVADRMHAAGKTVFFNSAWTRDPFEALYRYGVDYKRIAAAGIDGFIVETGAASLSIGGGGIEMEPCDEFKAMLLLIGAYVPQMKLICLNTIQDTTEEWDALRHAPVMLERDIFALSNLFRHEEDGGLSRCSAGMMACLTDGISEHDWNWIERRWELGYACQPVKLAGAALVWKDDLPHTELKHYIATRERSTHKWLHHLIAEGAPISSTVHLRLLEQMAGTLVAVNIHLWTDSELEQLLGYTGGPIVVIGQVTERMLNFHTGAAEAAAGSGFCAVRHSSGAWQLIAVTEEGGEGEQPDPGRSSDHLPWIYELYTRPVAQTFIRACAIAVSQHSDAPEIMGSSGCASVLAQQQQDGGWRLIIENRLRYYETVTIRMAREMKRISIATDFPGMPIVPEGKDFKVKVPGNGIVILNTELA
ncbi:hypothetical protein [Paenibacillus sp. GCM10027626]|uniref:hypothetical protein n=1 Tax=Paenibacillus sp. GCM10027626 TaxID=3273411 RepID=UPI00363F7EB6